METSPFCHMSVTGNQIDMKVGLKSSLLEQKERKESYDFTDDDLDFFKKRMQEFGLKWPLSDTQEKGLIAEALKKDPSRLEFDDYLIKEAYLQGGPVQRSAMLTIAANIDYHL